MDIGLRENMPEEPILARVSRPRLAPFLRKSSRFAAPIARHYGLNRSLYRSRKTFFCTLPIVLRGSSSTKNTRLGTL